MLYAGTTSILNFKYSILNDIVKKLKRWSKSAGNSYICLFYVIFINKTGTSETLRNETAINTERIKLISVHGGEFWQFSLCVRTKLRGNPKVLVTKIFKEIWGLAWLMTQGMVISLEIDERKMGNRGSKSDSIICKRATSRWFFSYYSCKVYSSRRETDSWEKNIFVLFSWLVGAVFLGVNVGLLSNWSELTELSNQYIFGDSFFSINLDLIPALIPFSYDT